jgi:hypothetical protein
MTQEDRTEWIKVALEAIGDVPRDLLEMACDKAKRVCDHPAKIIPFICKETEELTAWRKKQLRNAQAVEANRNAPRLERKPFELSPGDHRDIGAGLSELVADLERKARVG